MTNNMTTLQLLLGAGPVVKGVLILLVGASVASWTIIFRKIKEYKEISLENKKFKEIFYSNGEFNNLIQKSRTLSPSAFGKMFQYGCEELFRYQEKFGNQDYQMRLAAHFEQFGFDGIQRSLRVAVNEIQEKLESGLSTLASVGSIAPFVGLFGTVWGIMNSFTGLGQGGGSLELVAPGIAEALVATAIGLAAAIPAVYFYNFLGKKNQSLLVECDSFEKEFLNLVERTFSEEK